MTFFKKVIFAIEAVRRSYHNISSNFAGSSGLTSTTFVELLDLQTFSQESTKSLKKFIVEIKIIKFSALIRYTTIRNYAENIVNLFMFIEVIPSKTLNFFS